MGHGDLPQNRLCRFTQTLEGIVCCGGCGIGVGQKNPLFQPKLSGAVAFSLDAVYSPGTSKESLMVNVASCAKCSGNRKTRFRRQGCFFLRHRLSKDPPPTKKSQQDKTTALRRQRLGEDRRSPENVMETQTKITNKNAGKGRRNFLLCVSLFLRGSSRTRQTRYRTSDSNRVLCPRYTSGSPQTACSICGDSSR